MSAEVRDSDCQTFQHPPIGGGVYLIAPGEKNGVDAHVDFRFENGQMKGQIKTGEKSLFVWGAIEYRDIFYKVRRTTFKLKLGQSNINRCWDTLTLCDDGNHAD